MKHHDRNLRRHVSFVASYDPEDPAAWSGIPARMISELTAAGLSISALGPLRRRGDLFWRLQSRTRGMVGATSVQPDREPWVAEGYARQLTRMLQPDPPAAIISPGTIPIARLDTQIPVIVWADATFAAMRDYYASFTGLARRTLAHDEALETQALQRCAAAVFSSTWAAQSAIEHYGLATDRVYEIPFGANLDPELSSAEAEALVSHRSHATCELLFVGVDWQRKGADLAVEVVSLLNRRGLHAHLTIVGCEPPTGVRVPAEVRVVGFLPHASDARLGPLGRLFAGAHFLIVPTRAEAFGIVFAEASAFAVPSLATRTGGVASAVRNGINGWLFDLDASPEQYCSVVERLMADPQAYRDAALSAHQEYIRRLNWRSSCRRVAEVVQEVYTETSREQPRSFSP